MTTTKPITLGDIHVALKALVDQGAHPGSIWWVLKNQIDCECGNCDLCDVTQMLRDPQSAGQSAGQDPSQGTQQAQTGQ